MLQIGWKTLEELEAAAGPFWADVPIDACCVGTDAAEKLAAYARDTCGERALIVGDENTMAAAGKPLLTALSNAGKRIDEMIYPGDPLEATQEEADKVAEAGELADFYVACGSGTLCDLAKAAGSAQDKPVLLFCTAASMNGYTSSIVALKVRGLKRTLPCNPAKGVFADPEIVAAAPPRMVAAGVADFLSKCSSSTDWRAAHHIRGGFHTDRPRKLVLGIQEQLFDRAQEIGAGNPEAVGLALDALLLSGFGMVLAGSSAPASGGEHLISHYVDMKHALYGSSNDLHGIQVGVGTVYALGLWEKVLDLEPEDMDIDALVAAQPSQDDVHAAVMKDWGEQVGEEVWGQWCEKALDETAMRKELERIRDLLPKLREELPKDFQPAGVVKKCIEESGASTDPDKTEAPAEEYANAKRRARYLRNRFTILDLASELGLA